MNFDNPPAKPIRVACIGLGFIFKNAHAKAIRFLQSRGWPVEMAMVCDLNPQSLEAARAFFPNTKTTTNLEDVLKASTSLDALMICLWPEMSVQVLRRAIACGFKKILVEKPVSHRAAAILEAAKEARRAGTHVQVAYNRRHQPALDAFTDTFRKLCPQSSLSVTLRRVNRCEPLFYEDVMPHPLSVLHHLLGDLTAQKTTFGGMKNGIPEFLEANLLNTAGVQANLRIEPMSGQELELYEAHVDDKQLQMPLLPANTVEGPGLRSTQANAELFQAIREPAGLDESNIVTWRTGFIEQIAQFLADTPSQTACSLEQAASIFTTTEEILASK